MMEVTCGGEASRGSPLMLWLILQFLNWMVESVVSSHFNVIIHNLRNICYIYIIIYMLHKILKQEKLQEVFKYSVRIKQRQKVIKSCPDSAKTKTVL